MLYEFDELPRITPSSEQLVFCQASKGDRLRRCVALRTESNEMELECIDTGHFIMLDSTIDVFEMPLTYPMERFRPLHFIGFFGQNDIFKDSKNVC